MGVTDRLSSRRRFLSSTALGGLMGGLGLLVGTSAARAFTEQPMNAETHKLYADRCKLANDGYHEALLADERTKLGATLSPAELDRALAALRCPVCGCPLMAAAAPAAKAG